MNKKSILITVVITTFILFTYVAANAMYSEDNNSIETLNVSENEITKEQAVDLVIEMLQGNGGYIPKIVEVDNEDENTYLVHAYDVITHEGEGSHTATTGWYEVNKKTKAITNIME